MGLQSALTLFTQLAVGCAAQHLRKQVALCGHRLCRWQVARSERLRSQIAAYQPQPTRKQGWHGLCGSLEACLQAIPAFDEITREVFYGRPFKAYLYIMPGHAGLACRIDCAAARGQQPYCRVRKIGIGLALLRITHTVECVVQVEQEWCGDCAELLQCLGCEPFWRGVVEPGKECASAALLDPLIE